MTRAYVGLGSNLGNRERFLRRAVDALGELPGCEVMTVSSFYDTDPVGVGDQPPYLNAVAALDATAGPEQLLWNLLRIESRMGRSQAQRGGPRPIDLDLLWYGRWIVAGERLTLPHPRATERLFVLVPMVEVDPGWIDPRSGLRMDEILRERSNLGQVRWAGRFQM